MTQDSLLRDIRALEEALHDPHVRQSREQLCVLLSEDFQEFGASGTVYENRDAMIARLAEDVASPSGTVTAVDYSLRRLAPDVVLLTYRTIRAGAGTERHVLRSSVWKRSKGQWQMVFHQGTPTDAVSNPPA